MSLLTSNRKHKVSGPVFKQFAQNAGQAVSTLAVTLNGVTAGNTIIFIYTDVAGPSITSVTDSNGTLTTGVTNPATPGTAINQALYYKVGANSGTHTITINLSAVRNCTIVLFEVSGLTAYDTIVRATPGTTATSISTPTITPGGSPGFLIAQCGAYANVTSMTNPPTGFTSAGNPPDNLFVVETAYKITGSAISASWSWSGSTLESNATIIAFK